MTGSFRLRRISMVLPCWPVIRELERRADMYALVVSTNRRLPELGRISGIMVLIRSHCNNTPSISADHAVAVLMSPNPA